MASHLMVSHHFAKFGGQKHCVSGDIIFLVVEEQDCTYSLYIRHCYLCLKHVTRHTHEISERRHSPVLVTSVYGSN